MKTTYPSHWFTKVRGSYLPATWQGWLLYLPYIVYLVAVPLYVWQQNPSLANAALLVIPNWVAALVIMTWIADRLS